MEKDSKFTRDDNGNTAVRIFAGGDVSAQPDSMFTRDENGNVCVRVVFGEGGGGDSSNLGYFATLEALQEAHPTAEPGNWAIVGETDTVWVWDEDTSAWVDTDTKGQVTSVNNQTGAVTITADDILPDQTGNSGKILTTDGFVAGWVLPEIVQRSTMPMATEDESGKIYQYVGATDANYTNGYFYKCVSDGGNPATYSWVRLDVQPTPSGLPTQTGHAGEFLTTDGTDASWSDKPLVNMATGTNSLTILGTPNNTSYGLNIGANSQTTQNNTTAVGSYAKATGLGATAFGRYTTANGNYSICVGNYSTASGANSIAIGLESTASGANSIQISTKSGQTNSDANTFKVANDNGNFEIMSADGTIPEARLADTTSATEGQALRLDSNGNAVWENITTTPATAPTLVAANWSSNTQTITIQGVTATNTIIVSPIPTDAEDYAAAGILCTGQATNALTFTCQTVPASDLQVNIVIL